MASQAALFAETIAGMKKAVKRKAYDSDSDNSIEHITNRGNKLKKKARFVHDRQLAPPTGPHVYKRRVEHAGFQRDIIRRNPPLVDEDGYEIDSEDDERTEAAVAAAAELDPYSNVKIEYLLAPLTAVTDLPDHPTLSKPFLSKNLTELTQQAGDMVQKEKNSLWRIKHLLTRLSGDHTWIPCGAVETDNDTTFFSHSRGTNLSNGLRKPTAKYDADHLSNDTPISEEAAQQDGLQIEEAARPGETTPATTKTEPEKHTIGIDLALISTAQTLDVDAGQNVTSGAGAPEEDPGVTNVGSMGEGEVEMALEATVAEGEDGNQASEGIGVTNPTEGQEEDDAPAPHRMRTRAQAQAASDNTVRSGSVTPDPSMDSSVHPYFLAPRSSRPDRDLGLPKHEAEETRRLLQLYIQKQEEVCRGAQRVYEGLLKADRYRRLVMKWAKAEAHVEDNRDMSDGEDWYDKEEWGLEEDLKKGQDEEEEDAATTAKKTRTRRQ